jgi:AraC-like DNA-binding protein
MNVSFYWLHFTYQRDAFEVILNLSDIKNKLGTVMEGFSGIMIPEHLVTERNRITILIRQLLHCEEEQYYTSRISDLLMEMILIEITQNYMELYKNKNHKMQVVCDWIRANRYLRISLQDVANQFGYNKEYLARAFKAEMGITVKQYINNLQLGLAKRKLLETNETVEQIASEIGIEDAKVFMKLFKREENLTPTQYRNTFHKLHFNSK